MSAAENIDKNLSIGLGDAVERLVNLHTKVAGGFATPSEHAERTMLLSALNVVPLDLDFSCDISQTSRELSGISGVSMFEKSVSTSCCRLVPPTVSPGTGPVHATRKDPASPAAVTPAASATPALPAKSATPATTSKPAASAPASTFTMPKLGSRR